MFGLMLKQNCSTQEAERDHYRLHYCGTCKTIGKEYSQSARMMLNLDSVFLAEVLTALSEADTAKWQESYHAYNCFASGGEGEALPPSLRFAAATNVLFTALKTDDNLKDSTSFFWRMMKRYFDKDFQKAEAEMQSFGVEMKEIWQWIDVQQTREKEKNALTNEKAMTYFAEPTAQITALVFAKGASFIGKENENMYQLGYYLGELMYGLDALEDVEKDTKMHNFNALQKGYGEVSTEIKAQVADYLFTLSQNIQQKIQQLPIPVSQQVEFSHRLSANLATRVMNALEGKTATAQNAKRTLFSRLNVRAERAKSFAERMTCNAKSWTSAPQYGVYYAAAFIAPKLPQAMSISTNSPSPTPSLPTGMWAVMAVLGSLLFVKSPFIKEFKRIYLMELKRMKNKIFKGRENNMALWVIVALLAVLLIVIVAVIAACANICNNLSCGC